MDALVRLRVTGGLLQGKQFDFRDHQTFLFGRGLDCHLKLPEDDPTASRYHFLLEVNPPMARLRDLGSLNGTAVNGLRCGGRGRDESPEQAKNRAQPEIDLKHGDEVRVGNHVFVVEILGAPSVVPAPTAFLPPTQASAGAPAAPIPTQFAPVGRVAPTVHDPSLSAPPARSAVSPPPASTPAAPPPGAAPAVPGYRVERLLAEGGMGAVFLARSLTDGSRVALKTMLPRTPITEAKERMFLREIEVMQSLNHPNLVRVLGRGQIEGGFYFLMEFCEGGSVEALLAAQGGRLPPRAAVNLILDALAGLAEAHSRGFIHRDLKPANLLLDRPGGRAKVTDFGLAKNFQLAGFSGMTVTGAAGGTLPFMPREQLINYKYARPSTDVWAMAATLYHMLTGAYPFDFQSDPNHAAVVLRGQVVPLASRIPGLPPALYASVDRALSTQENARQPDASALLADLRQASVSLR